MPVQPDEDLFEIFSNSFFGFGHFKSPMWFVGPGSSVLTHDEAEIAQRLEYWHRRGQPQLTDLKRFHTMIGDETWVGEDPKLHRVWSKLARMCLAMEGRKVEGNVRSYQADELGRTDGSSALLHVLPVNVEAEAEWPYARLERPYLRRPDLYADRFAARRLRYLVRKIKRYRPRIVICYDLTHRAWWEQLSGQGFEKTSIRDCFIAEGDPTSFLMVRHPESIGTRNDYFVKVGRLAAEYVTNARD